MDENPRATPTSSISVCSAPFKISRSKDKTGKRDQTVSYFGSRCDLLGTSGLPLGSNTPLSATSFLLYNCNFSIRFISLSTHPPYSSKIHESTTLFPNAHVTEHRIALHPTSNIIASTTPNSSPHLHHGDTKQSSRPPQNLHTLLQPPNRTPAQNLAHSRQFRPANH